MRALPVVSHAAALAGLFFASKGWFAVLAEGLHTSHMGGHRLGLVGQALYNVVLPGPSPVMDALALCLIITLALVAITQTWVSRAANAAGRFLDAHAACLVTWLATMLALTLVLWHEDFRHLPPSAHRDPRPWALLVVPCLTFLPGIVLAVPYRTAKRGAYLFASSAVPLLAAILVTLAFPARLLEETWRMEVQDWYPRPGWVLCATGGLLAAHLVVYLLWRRATPRGAEVGALVLAGWCWFLMSVVVLGIMMPHHILLMGFSNPYAGVQEQAMICMPLVFGLLWAAIGAVQWARYRARARRAA